MRTWMLLTALIGALALGACSSTDLGPGKADPDPQDQTPNH